MEIDRTSIGQFLARRRNELDLSQVDVAKRLKYKNHNYITMIERGNAAPPLSRLHEFITTYEIDPVFALIVVCYLYKEVWNAVAIILQTTQGFYFEQEIEDIEKDINEKAKALLSE